MRIVAVRTGHDAFPDRMPVGSEGLRALFFMTDVTGLCLGKLVERIIFHGMYVVAGRTDKIGKLVLATTPVKGIPRGMASGTDPVLVLGKRATGGFLAEHHIRWSAPAVYRCALHMLKTPAMTTLAPRGCKWRPRVCPDCMGCLQNQICRGGVVAYQA
jgi:hypothetical protein